MTAARKKLRKTLDARDIPREWVRLSSFGSKSDVRYEAVYRAIHSGRITDDECIKFQSTDIDPRGPIYVCPLAADREITAAAEQSRSASRQQGSKCSTERASVDDAIRVLHEIKDGISLIGETVRDLSAAVQLLAEQQSKHHEPVGSWRDMNSDVLN